jgi:hypothetical protein
MQHHSRLAAALVLTASVGPAHLASAHGIQGHVHVTGWAIETLPEGELKTFFADPAVKNAALVGAFFPDSGYAIGDGYGEIAHWEPFVDAHIDWVRTHLGPPFESEEARLHAAFLMGGASHGLQDEIFDSIFLHQIRLHDDGGQDVADPGTDAMLFTDGWVRFRPEVWSPSEDLPEIFLDSAGHEVEARTIRTGLGRIEATVINAVEVLYPTLDAQYRPQLPWTAEHYLDPSIPGSLTSEVPATRAYMEALWARLHDEWPVTALVGHAYPDEPYRLRTAEAGTVDSWVTLAFGIGALVGSLNEATVSLRDGVGEPVEVEVRHTRWSGSPEDSTRLLQLRPRVDLEWDSQYEVRIEPGVRLVDGTTTDVGWSYRFRTPCAPENAADCPPPADPGLPPPPPPDAALPEADASVDAAIPEADAGRADATTPSDPTPDAAAGPAEDAAVGSADADTRDGDAPMEDGSEGSGDDSGCSATSSGTAPAWLLLLAGPLLLGGPLSRRRARRGGRGSRG